MCYGRELSDSDVLDARVEIFHVEEFYLSVRIGCYGVNLNCLRALFCALLADSLIF